MQSASAWLHSIGLGQYSKVFADNYIDLDVIARLTEADLEKLGVEVHHREKLLEAVSRLGPGVLSNRSTTTPGRGHYMPAHLAERIRSSRSALEGERKQVTVLFADLRGSMEMLAERDPEEARRLLDPVVELMMEAVHHYEGTVNQVMGDGIMALFGAPLALEDHAVRAAYAALRMQERVHAYAANFREVSGESIRIRVGLNSGEVLVRSIGSDLHMDYTAVGQATHLAARMEQAAEAGSILMTAETARLVEGYIESQALGHKPIRGLDEPREVFKVLRAGSARSRLQAVAARGLTPFVGRSEEIGRLERALEDVHSSNGRVIGLMGEAGVGKSRLLWEFIHSTRTQGCMLLEAQATPYTKDVAYAPMIDMLTRYFDVQERHEPTRIRQQVTERLEHLGNSIAPFIPAFLSLLDIPVDEPEWLTLDPLLRRARTITGIQRLLALESQKQMLILVIEDLNWADSETNAVVRAIIDTLADSRILLLLSYRPEHHHAWSVDAAFMELRLASLPLRKTDDLLGMLLGDDPGLGELKRLLWHQTTGNPLFLEESVRALVETGVLAGKRGAYRLTKSLPGVQIPASLVPVLAARIDRLPDSDKRLLQAAAVIGKDVPVRLLAAVSDLPESDLRTGLSHLREGDFLYQRTLFPNVEYTFKHALTHEVAYGGLLKDRRRLLHSRIVDVIKRLYAGRLLEHCERLAFHALRSERWAESAEYSLKAGRKAIARSANREAVVYLDQALDALKRCPEERDNLVQAFEIRLELRSALIPLGEFERVFQTLHELEALADRLTDLRRQGLVAALMAGAYPSVGRHDRATEYGERARRIALEIGDRTMRILAHTYLSASYFFLGKHQQSIESGRAALKELPAGSRERLGVAIHPAVFARAFLSWSQSEVGEFVDAEVTALEALELAEETEHPQTVAGGLLVMGTFHVRRGDVTQAVAYLERGSDICHRYDIPLWRPVFASFLGYSLALSGRFVQAQGLLRQAIDQATRMRLGAFHSQMIMWLSESCLLTGVIDEAGKLAASALEMARDRKEAGLEAWALRLSAEIATQRDLTATQAEQLYRQATDKAEPLGLRPLIARCHLGLGSWYRRCKRNEEAKHHLCIASQMFDEMRMRFWMDRAIAEHSAAIRADVA